MLIVHLFPYEKFTQPYIDFINKNFQDNHTFIIYGEPENNKIQVKEGKNVIFINKSINSLFLLHKFMSKADKILFHNFSLKGYMMAYLCVNKILLKKCNWVIWGGDLYSYRNPKKSLKEKLVEVMRKFIIKRLGSVTSLVYNDYKLAQKWYKTKAKHFEGMYIAPTKIETLDECKTIVGKSGIHIQIGNSAYPSNNHIEVLELLFKFKEENINIFCPLSYGDKTYAKEVIEYGKKLFGEKFIPLTEFMNEQEYANFLSKIDIAIFNNDRQQALGNIFALAYLEKKIYLRADTTMWEELVKREKYVFNNIKELEDICFDEFIKSEYVKENSKIAKLRFSDEHIKKVWEKIFKESE